MQFDRRFIARQRHIGHFIYGDEMYPVYSFTSEGLEIAPAGLRQRYLEAWRVFSEVQRELADLLYAGEKWTLPTPVEDPPPFPYEQYELEFEFSGKTSLRFS